MLTTAPPLPAAPARAHGAKRVLQAEAGANDIDVAHAAQIGRLDVDHQRCDFDPGVIDEDVEAAEFCDRCRDRLLPAPFFRHVERAKPALAPVAAIDFAVAWPASARISPIITAAPARRGFRHALAKTTRAAGHQRLATRQIELTHGVSSKFLRNSAADPKGAAVIERAGGMKRTALPNLQGKRVEPTLSVIFLPFPTALLGGRPSERRKF